MRPLILIFVCCFSLARAQKIKIVYDSTIKLVDLDKIKDVRSIVHYSNKCNVTTYEFYFQTKKILRSEITQSYDSLETRFNKYLLSKNFKKGDYFMLEVRRTSCKLLLRNTYKFKID